MTRDYEIGKLKEKKKKLFVKNFKTEFKYPIS